MLQDPWKRVKTPTTLPEFTSVEDLHAIEDSTLEQILRDHLDPASTASSYVSHWRRFWGLLAFDEDLNERATAIIEQFTDQATSALESGALDETQDRRASRFLDRCVKSLDRLDRAEEDPLGWAGAQAAGFNPRSRAVIAVLVAAIDDHRRGKSGAGSAADRRLWAALRRVHLDPRDY